MWETVVQLVNKSLNVDCLNIRLEGFLLCISSNDLKFFQIRCKHMIPFAEVCPRTAEILLDGTNCCLQAWLHKGEVNIFFLKDTR